MHQGTNTTDTIVGTEHDTGHQDSVSPTTEEGSHLRTHDCTTGSTDTETHARILPEGRLKELNAKSIVVRPDTIMSDHYRKEREEIYLYLPLISLSYSG